MNNVQLQLQIEKQREKLIDIAKTEGLSSDIVIKNSQILDNLINKYNQKYQKAKM